MFVFSGMHIPKALHGMLQLHNCQSQQKYFQISKYIYMTCTYLYHISPLLFGEKGTLRKYISKWWQLKYFSFLPWKLGKIFTHFDMRTLFRWVGEKPPTRYAIPPDLIYDEAGNYLWLCCKIRIPMVREGDRWQMRRKRGRKKRLAELVQKKWSRDTDLFE